MIVCRELQPPRDGGWAARNAWLCRLGLALTWTLNPLAVAMDPWLTVVPLFPGTSQGVLPTLAAFLSDSFHELSTREAASQEPGGADEAMLRQLLRLAYHRTSALSQKVSQPQQPEQLRYRPTFLFFFFLHRSLP